jgi:uncharacterized protein (TIGR01777 family)
MKVLVSGSTGLIGTALVSRLREAGHVVVRLVRNASSSEDEAVVWDPAAGTLDGDRLAGLDAAVHLAGESVGTTRWTAEKKARIRDSRVQGTRLLAGALAGCTQPPGVFACASAIGYYGSRGDDVLTEESTPGKGFLAGVCREWEAAAREASRPETRVVNLRFGVVLSADGGALASMLPLFRKGAGGRVGNGRQWWSWITLEDAVAAIEHVIATPPVEGPVNVVAPEPVTNRTFTTELARALGRPALLPLPAFAARLALGEMADELLLASARAQPARLVDTGFCFRQPKLEGALASVLA